MALQFNKAVRRKRKARIAFVGPTGSGKTWSALLVARGLVGPEGRIAVIDTERGSASLYEHLTPFDVLELDSFAPERYVEAIHAAAGYDALVIDSWSHAWAGKDGLLEFVDQQKKRNRGNEFAVWGDATPKQNAMVETILSAPCHILATMRSKMAYVLEDQERNGRRVQVPRKLGMQPIQRDGVEYEFDVVADLDLDHNLVIAKTRYAGIADKVFAKPGIALGEELRAWFEAGEAPPPPAPETPDVILRREATAAMKAAQVDAQKHGKTVGRYLRDRLAVESLAELEPSRLDEARALIPEAIEHLKGQAA